MKIKVQNIKRHQRGSCILVKGVIYKRRQSDHEYVWT